MTLHEFAKWHGLTITPTPNGAGSVVGHSAMILPGDGQHLIFAVRTGSKPTWRTLRARLVQAGLDVRSNHAYGGSLSFDPQDMRQVQIVLSTFRKWIGDKTLW